MVSAYILPQAADLASACTPNMAALLLFKYALLLAACFLKANIIMPMVEAVALHSRFYMSCIHVLA